MVIRWRWCISTNTDQKIAKLILKVSAEQPNEILKDKDIQIEVDNSTWLRSIRVFLQDNPEAFLSLLVIPLLIWLYRLAFGRKKKASLSIPR
ncbi:hypothetical protein A4R26_32260 [Niastella populi]|uniref:Uncharacterized protein n=1 Tax=Niastella populi TaxID=550983 RepID=A0A1V9EGZ1_9BACT|nr:hypothetical protein A4R26_32260 [Niastella populi]